MCCKQSCGTPRMNRFKECLMGHRSEASRWRIWWDSRVYREECNGSGVCCLSIAWIIYLDRKCLWHMAVCLHMADGLRFTTPTPMIYHVNPCMADQEVCDSCAGEVVEWIWIPPKQGMWFHIKRPSLQRYFLASAYQQLHQVTQLSVHLCFIRIWTEVKLRASTGFFQDRSSFSKRSSDFRQSKQRLNSRRNRHHQR